MSSLYRKYRPGRFTEIIGQDHIRTNLEQALSKGTIGHAYLFSGPRGTGKTSLARLFAAALNCPNRGEGAEACGKCEICLEIANGSSVDIIEIDAASNRGIDEIRELRDKIGFAPTRGAYKVYIIDEVHMLTPPAFNALLKTLEEPPKHAIFILATTELHKVPETIISRTQRFAFHRASSAALETVLKKVVKAEKIPIEPDALAVIISRAEGSFRDSLTMLGSVSNTTEKLTAESLRTLLGLPQTSLVEAAHLALKNGDAPELLKLLREVISEGGDVVVLVKAMSDQLKDELINGHNEAADTGLLEQLLVLLARIRQSSDPTALVVARLYELALRQTKTGSSAVVAAPIKPIEPTAPVIEQVAAATLPSTTTVTDLKATASSDEPKEVDAVTATAPNPPAAVKPADSGDFWNQFLSAVKESNHALYAVLRSAELESLTEEKVVIAVKFRFYSERLLEAKNRKVIEKAAAAVAGKPLLMECQVRPELNVQSPEEDLISTVVNVFEVTQ